MSLPPTSSVTNVSVHEQASVLEIVRQGRNVFYMGNAGTGKTFLLQRIVDGACPLIGASSVPFL